MTIKYLQNTYEKSKLEWVKKSKLFHKRDASKFNKIKKTLSNSTIEKNGIKY